MSGADAFELWLEWEHWVWGPNDDPSDDFANVVVTLSDGRRFALNVWTFKFLNRARAMSDMGGSLDAPADHIVPPDLLVERLDRTLLERVVSKLVAEDDIREHWLCPPREEDDAPVAPRPPKFQAVVEGLLKGDFSASAEVFEPQLFRGKQRSRIEKWCREGCFSRFPEALAEALSCACFLGKLDVVRFLLKRGVDPLAGNRTGMDAFHWAVNRGNLEVVKLLIHRRTPMETINMHGGTVLGAAVWSAIHEPRDDHLAIIEALLAAGARREAVALPTGHAGIDELFARAST